MAFHVINGLKTGQRDQANKCIPCEQFLSSYFVILRCWWEIRLFSSPPPLQIQI